MRKKPINDSHPGLFLILMILLALNGAKNLAGKPRPGNRKVEQKVFVEVSGAVKNPGVYGFSDSPTARELFLRSGQDQQGMSGSSDCNRRYNAGAKITVSKKGNQTSILEGRMSAFYKMTLGIPISINQQCLNGLTALPGVGPKIAAAIIAERSRRDGFDNFEEVIAVRGIGPKLMARLRPLVSL
jgi:competence protein ComEA